VEIAAASSGVGAPAAAVMSAYWREAEKVEGGTFGRCIERSRAAPRVASFLFQVCDEDVVFSRVRQQDFPEEVISCLENQVM
jgi:hypothetical protein